MKKIVQKIVGIISVAGMVVLVSVTAQAGTAWNVGDLAVAVSGGSYQIRDNTGLLKETISDGMGGFTTGCAWNNNQSKLYTTNFSATKVVVYNDPSPHAISQIVNTNATSPGGHSESIVFDAFGNYYVGHPDGNDLIHKYDAAGNLLATYAVAVDARGTDWIDLAADQSTLYYTSEGRAVQRYDTAANMQLSNFAVLPVLGNAFALRLLPPGDGSGGLLVADGSNVKRLDGAGVVVQTYDVAGENSWFSLNLDPNGTSFWAGNFGSANVYKFNIATGVVETSFNTGTGSGTVFGICLKGEPTAALPPDIALNPPTATNEIGTTHTVTATVTQGGQPVANVLINFSVTSGPNAGQMSDPGECATDPNCNTDSAGQTSWTYTGNGGVGTDVIIACFADAKGQKRCAKALKEWVDRTPPKAACTESVNPHGSKIPPAGSTTLPGSKGGQNEDGFYHLTAVDNSGLPVDIRITNLSGTASFGPFPSSTTVKITEAPGATPAVKPMGSSNGQAGAVTAHVTLDSDALMVATDAAGNQTTVSCLVPPPPK